MVVGKGADGALNDSEKFVPHKSKTMIFNSPRRQKVNSMIFALLTLYP